MMSETCRTAEDQRERRRKSCAIPVSEWFNLRQQTKILGPTLVDGQQQPMQITGLASFVQQIFYFQCRNIHLHHHTLPPLISLLLKKCIYSTQTEPVNTEQSLTSHSTHNRSFGDKSIALVLTTKQ